MKCCFNIHTTTDHEAKRKIKRKEEVEDNHRDNRERVRRRYELLMRMERMKIRIEGTVRIRKVRIF